MAADPPHRLGAQQLVDLGSAELVHARIIAALPAERLGILRRGRRGLEQARTYPRAGVREDARAGGAARRTHRNRRRPLHLGRARGDHMALGGHSRAVRLDRARLVVRAPGSRGGRRDRGALPAAAGEGRSSGDRGPRPASGYAGRAAEHSARGGRLAGVRSRCSGRRRRSSRSGWSAAGSRRTSPGAERDTLRTWSSPAPSRRSRRFSAARSSRRSCSSSWSRRPAPCPRMRSDTCCSPASSPPAPAT